MVALTDAPVPLGEYVPSADQRIVIKGVGWQGYRALQQLRGERRRPRIAYLNGAVELMTTSRQHEEIKGTLGKLVETYCEARSVPWSRYGNWTLDDESKDAGAEPDECYIFGPDPDAKQWPDLVIEVIWTSGGLDKLESYRRLGIREVWFWKNGTIGVHVLGSDGYEPRDESVAVPGVDLSLLCELANIKPMSEAATQLRARLQQAR